MLETAEDEAASKDCFGVVEVNIFESMKMKYLQTPEKTFDCLKLSSFLAKLNLNFPEICFIAFDWLKILKFFSLASSSCNASCFTAFYVLCKFTHC